MYVHPCREAQTAEDDGKPSLAATTGHAGSLAELGAGQTGPAWLALHFPFLPLDLHARADPDQGPLALCTRAHERRILLCNARAAAAGVSPGQSAAAALALAADLRLSAYAPESERQGLERLAGWAYRFSSHISLVSPCSLLLEAGRSLLLFGGAQSLMRDLLADAEKLGCRLHWCLAPTAEGALLLAREGVDAILAGLPQLYTVLASAPVSALPVAEKERQTLAAMGLRRIGEVLRLPREGLARRFGPAFVDYLYRLRGQLPDPRPAFMPPDRFRSRLELPAEVTDTRALLFAARRLLVELCAFLLGRGLGAQRMEWMLFHPQRRRSRLELAMARPGRDAEHMVDLLRERLERFELPEPVREIGLRVDDLPPLQAENRSLLPETGRQQADRGERLLERLRARLGAEALIGLEVVADHRPERAWRQVAPGRGRAGEGNPRRPLWLLPQPVQLRQHDGWPLYGGQRLSLERERERIEAGWWDGESVARDYFTARLADGRILWVFRELAGARRWFLHGWFV